MIRNGFFKNGLIVLTVPFLCLIFLWVSCSKKNKETDAIPIAEVYEKILTSADLEGIVPLGMTGQDSALIVNAYTQRWAKEALMMHEAEQNLPKDLDIDQLVRDYRASLIRFKYEERLMEEKMDSTVMESELKGYYEQNKDQFQLDNTILRINLLKIPTDAPQNELNKLWYDKKKKEELAIFAKKWSSVSLLKDEQWHTLDAIRQLLPEGALTLENIGQRKEGTLSDDNSIYYFRVLETVRGKQTAPYEYAREQALKVILHKRKREFMERWKEDLYQKALKKEDVVIY